MSFLSDILKAKRKEIKEAKRRVPEAGLLAGTGHERRDFAAALQRPGEPAVIAEVKRASPSRGPIAPGLDLPHLVGRYEAGGAAAISVLTDCRFMGHLDDLEKARRVTALPLLRKDFIIDPYQVAEAYHAGADAVLLIAACLDKNQLRELLDAAARLSLAALVETRSPARSSVRQSPEPR